MLAGFQLAGMMGAGLGERVRLNGPATLSDTSATVTNSKVNFRIDSDGQIYYEISVVGGFVAQYVWMLSGVNTDYQARYTLTGGDAPTGSALSTWLDTNADITWGHLVIVVGAQASTGTVEIRDKVTLGVLATITLNMDAEEA